MWTVFKEQIEIDQKQMEVIRNVTYTHDGKEARMFNNYRDVQLEHGREIFDVDIDEIGASLGNSSPSPLQPFLQRIVFVSFAALIKITI